MIISNPVEALNNEFDEIAIHIFNRVILVMVWNPKKIGDLLVFPLISFPEISHVN